MPTRPLLLPALTLILALTPGTLLAGVSTIETFIFEMAGNQEVPPLPSPARGGCLGLLDQGAAEFTLACSHNVPGPTLIHIHRANAGANGPVAFDLGDPVSPVDRVWSGMSPADIADLLSGGLYVNVHSSGRPDGEIRGQIRKRTGAGFSFLLDGDQQVPPVITNAVGACSAELSDDATMLSAMCVHDVANVTAAHLHNAPPDASGPVVFDFSDPTSTFSGTKAMSRVDVAELIAGFYYVNVHAPLPSNEPDPSGDPGVIRGNVINPPPIFADGFESGNTSSWSASLGGSP